MKFTQTSPAPSQHLRLVLTVAVVVVGMLLGIGIVVANRRGGLPGFGGSGRTDAGQAAATRLNALLAKSVDGRKHLLTAIDSATACHKSPAVKEIQAAMAARKALIAEAGRTDLSGLGDDGLKPGLLGFLRASYASDQAYLHWVQSASGCPSTKAAAFRAVGSANSRARSAKTAFLADWNPVAERYDLPARDVTSI